MDDQQQANTLLMRLTGRTIKQIIASPGAWEQGEWGVLIFVLDSGIAVQFRDISEEAEGIEIIELNENDLEKRNLSAGE